MREGKEDGKKESFFSNHLKTINMKKFILAAALICAGTFAPQTEAFGSTAQNHQTTLKGPDVGVMEGWVFCSVPTGVINQVDVFNSAKQIVASSVCFDEECNVDISLLPKGHYSVVVQTSKWGTFLVPITISK